MICHPVVEVEGMRNSKKHAVQDSATPAANAPAVSAVTRPTREERQVPLATAELPRELERYAEQFYDVFGRAETFDNFCAYTVGLLSDLPRKNGETMTTAIESVANKEAIHRLLALSPWSAEELDRRRVRHALEVASTGQDGMLIVDEVSQLKQGKHSVGVKRQYLGCVGKRANGQVAVTVHYADARHDWPVTGRLYLPEDWAEDAERRKKAGVPEDVTFATKGEIALDLIRRALAWGIPAQWVSMDAGYDSVDLLITLEQMGLSCCVGVKSSFMVRAPEEVEEWVPPPPARRGRPRIHVDPQSLPPVCRVDALRDALPEEAWRNVIYRQGTAGPLTKQFAALDVQCATTTKVGPAVWLLFERPLPGEAGDSKYYVVSARHEMALEDLAQVAHRRPLIERFSYENGKGEVGLRDYQGRSWRGFHHHLAIVMFGLTWLSLQRRPLPVEPTPPAPPPTSGTPSAGPSAIVFMRGDSPVTVQMAGTSPVPVPAPRHLWESVQAVRRRFTEWCAIAVYRALAQRGTSLSPPAFVPLC